jgi:hypothetical protein
MLHKKNRPMDKIQINSLKGFEVLTVLTMKSYIFWDILLCSLMKVSRCFEGTYRFHLQGRRISHPGNQHEAGSMCSPALPGTNPSSSSP